MILELAQLTYGARLLADASIIGTYQEDDAQRARKFTRNIYDISRFMLVADDRVRKDKKTAGQVSVNFDPDPLSKSAQRLSYDDIQQSLKEYTLTTTERLALRAKLQRGLPAYFSFGWSRFQRGPMSPTLENEAVRVSNTATDGGNFTITAPTSGNLLVIIHGYFWSGAGADQPAATDFTWRAQGGNASTEVVQAILDKIATGSEGTTIAVTNGGVSQECSGWIGEYSGMTATPFVAAIGSDASTSNVETLASGTVDTTGTADTLLIAGLGRSTENSPSSFSWSNSFSQINTVTGDLGGNDHATNVATRVVSSASTYSTTPSWTGACNAAVVLGAYAILTSSAPVNTVPSSGKCINTYGETAVPGISVAAGSSAITAVATTCTAGCTLTYDTTGTSVTISGNGTNAATLSNGASEAEWTTVLDTLTTRGTTPDTTITVTIIPTDGTLNDSDQFTVMCDPASITITGTNANVITAVGTLQIRLRTGQTHDTISVNVVDDTGGTPLEADSSFIVGVSSYCNGSSTYVLRQLLRRRRKKKSGN